MPAHLAAMKWPASCTNTSTPSTTMRETIVVSTMTSRTSNELGGALARPTIGLPYRGQGGGGRRRMLVEHSLDDLGNTAERDPAVEKRRHGHFVGRVEHGRRDPARSARGKTRGERSEHV